MHIAQTNFQPHTFLNRLLGIFQTNYDSTFNNYSALKLYLQVIAWPITSR